MSAPDPQLSRTTAPAAALAEHGGRLSAARATFPGAPEPWIDLSTGINPHAYPIADLPPQVWRRLPDPQDVAGLEAAARACYGVRPAAGLVAAPGTQSLIGLLPSVRRARRVAVLGFGYQGHPAAWTAAGAAVDVTAGLDACAAADVAVVVNPNNPDGRHIAPEALLALAARLADHDGLLVVDEAFAEAADPGASLVPHLAGRNVLALRSFGKFFGLAGLRLGFAAGDAALCAALSARLGPWAVSGPAVTIGATALADTAWQVGMRRQLAAEATRLDAMLEGAGLAIVGGTSLFRLARHPAADAVFARLGRAGILVRPFRSEPDWLRFGLPGDDAAWDRLARALRP